MRKSVVGAPGVGRGQLVFLSARNRTAISRACYGAFHYAVELMAAFDVEIKANHTGHQEAYIKLFQSKIPRAREAARLLHDLRGERNRADYHLNKPVPEDSANARHCVESAHDFHACAEDCLKEPIRAQLAEAFSQ